MKREFPRVDAVLTLNIPAPVRKTLREALRGIPGVRCEEVGLIFRDLRITAAPDLLAALQPRIDAALREWVSADAW